MLFSSRVQIKSGIGKNLVRDVLHSLALVAVAPTAIHIDTADDAFVQGNVLARIVYGMGCLKDDALAARFPPSVHDTPEQGVLARRDGGVLVLDLVEDKHLVAELKPSVKIGDRAVSIAEAGSIYELTLSGLVVDAASYIVDLLDFLLDDSHGEVRVGCCLGEIEGNVGA